MGGAVELSGPDLKVGVALADLEQDKPFTGHADGEAVILVRKGEEVFAIGAQCTHYGGPLAEGLVVGDTIRCPWHHACFSLRTAEVLRPPALLDVARWMVEVRDSNVRVTQKVEAETTSRNVQPTDVHAVVIIGAGAAGNAAAETMRRDGFVGTITIIDVDAEAPYDRPNLSKDYLAGNAQPDWIPLHPQSYYEELRIALVLGHRVISIDTEARRVLLDDGSVHVYDRLLLATGSSPVKLSPPSDDGAIPIHYLRSFADSRSIIEAAEGNKRAVVLGASFIGLEVAASLRARNVEVHVVAPEDRPLGRVLGPELSDFVRKLHEEKGVIFHLGRKLASLQKDGVTLDNGERLDADFVVAGVGVQPNVGLAEQAGISVEKGVLVDEFFETSAPGVFAAGDIARYVDPRTQQRIRIEHWVAAERQGQHTARTMIGARHAFDAVPFFWSAHYDVTIAYVGHAEKWTSIEILGDIGAKDCEVRYRDGETTLAVATIFRDRESLEAEVTMEHETRTALEKL